MSDVASVYPGFRDPLTQHLDYTARRTGERTASAWLPLREDLRSSDDRILRGLVGYLTDATAGVVCGMAAVPSWVVTADLELRIVSEPRVGPLRADAIVRRPGRRQSMGEVVVYDEGDGDRVVSVGTVNHIVVPASPDVDVPADMPIGVTYVRETPAEAPPGPLLELLQIRRTDDGIELPISGIAVNPLGFLHGGLISLLAELCVEQTCDAPLGDLVVRFVGPVAAGTARATPTVVKGDEGIVVRIDVVDHSGRPGAIASARPAGGL